MKIEEIETALQAIGCEIGKDGDKPSFDFHGGHILIEDLNGETMLSSMVGRLSEVQESNLPNVVIGFLDANSHLQPASVGISVEEHDVLIKVLVMLNDKASLKKSLKALEKAIKEATSILTHASEEVVA